MGGRQREGRGRGRVQQRGDICHFHPPAAAAPCHTPSPAPGLLQTSTHLPHICHTFATVPHVAYSMPVPLIPAFRVSCATSLHSSLHPLESGPWDVGSSPQPTPSPIPAVPYLCPVVMNSSTSIDYMTLMDLSIQFPVCLLPLPKPLPCLTCAQWS